MVHAAVANLNQYIGDNHFDQIMDEIKAAQEEGLDSFELDVLDLDASMKKDLLIALDILGYYVNNSFDERFYIKYE